MANYIQILGKHPNNFIPHAMKTEWFPSQVDGLGSPFDIE